jgi:hypothetical protein
MMSTIRGKGHPRMISIKTTIKMDDAIIIFRITMVPAKFRPASEETTKEIIGIIITGAMINEVIIEMHQDPVGKTIDPGSQGHTMCHPRIVEWALPNEFFVDSNGRRQSGHLQKDCRTFQALQRVTEMKQAEAVRRGYIQGPRSEVHVPSPPPPTITSADQHLFQIAAPPATNDGFTNTRGAVSMIQMGRPLNRS